MGQPAGIPTPSYRARPPQVLLGVGAVLLVSGAAAAMAAHGGGPAHGVLLLLAVLAAAVSVRAARADLRGTEETFAACAVGLAAFGSAVASGSAGAGAGRAAGLLGGFLLLHRAAGSTATWPLAAWFAAQAGAVRVLPVVPPSRQAEVFLGVALAGLLLALGRGRLVPRLAAVTTAPWEVAGILAGARGAWSGPPGGRWVDAGLLAAAAAGLLLARLRPALDPLLGPPRLVPVLAGLVTGAGLSGALAAEGTAGLTAAGYIGVLAATTVPELLAGWRRGLLAPVAVAGGSLMAGLALARLAAGAQWPALALLFLLTALPAAVVAVLRPRERPATVPTAAGCLAGAVLLAVPAGLLRPGAAAVLLTVLLAAALAVAGSLPAGRRHPVEVTATGCAAAAVALVAGFGTGAELAGLLALQGAVLLGWALAVARISPSPAWRVAAVELVLACWIAAAQGGVRVLEAYSLPLAAGLLAAAGPRLARGPSWPAWGPGLLVAAVPSAILAVAEPGAARPVAVLLLAAAVMVAGARSGVRAPLTVGAGTALTVAIGLALAALPWPVAVAVATGAVLLALGAVRERRPVAGFGVRLADLR